MFVQHPEFRDYLIFDDGKVVSIKKGKWKELKPFNNGYGYLYIELSKDKKAFSKTIHRLVMEAFEGKSELHINHKDGNKLNNCLENLEYVTQKQNNQHAREIGLNNNFGENHYKSKITESQVLEILSLKGQLSQQKIAEKFNISVRNVCRIHRGEIWKHLQKK